MIEFFQRNRFAKIVFIVISMITVYFVWDNAPLMYRSLHIKIASLRLALRGLITIIPMTVFLLCIHKPSDIFVSMGLNKNIFKGLGLR